MNGPGAVTVAAGSLTTCAQARSLLASTSPATKTTTAERRSDWAMRSVQGGVPKAVLVTKLVVVFTVHITRLVTRTTVLKADNHLSIHSMILTSLSTS